MKLTPQSWIWRHTVAQPGWLSRCSDGPVVWLAWLTDAPDIESRLFSLLSSDEWARHARFQQREDGRRFLVGRGLLRILAGAHLGIAPAEVQFGYGLHGKPFIRGFAGSFQFNVSHSGDLVLLAFHSNREVGVDVEQVRPTAELANLAREMFSGREHTRWCGLAAGEQVETFYRAWTRHEAAVKAVGTGLAGGRGYSEGAQAWLELALPEGYAGYVCCSS